MSTQFKETDVFPHAFGIWNNDLVFLAPNILTDYYVLSDKVKIETSLLFSGNYAREIRALIQTTKKQLNKPWLFWRTFSRNHHCPPYAIFLKMNQCFFLKFLGYHGKKIEKSEVKISVLKKTI